MIYKRINSKSVVDLFPNCRLMELKHLTRLHLSNQCSEYFTFYEGVAPILSACQTLKSLVLEEFTEMDIGFIGKSCPGLTHLAISCADTFAPVLHIYPDLFRKLTSLELWNRRSAPSVVCEMSLKQILFNAPLVKVLFRGLFICKSGFFSFSGNFSFVGKFFFCREFILLVAKLYFCFI